MRTRDQLEQYTDTVRFYMLDKIMEAFRGNFENYQIRGYLFPNIDFVNYENPMDILEIKTSFIQITDLYHINGTLDEIVYDLFGEEDGDHISLELQVVEGENGSSRLIVELHILDW